MTAAPALFGGGMAVAPTASATDLPVVLDFADYGVCDGVTNDALAFQHALTELGAAGGGRQQLPPNDIAILLTTLPTFDVPANVEVVGHAG